MQTHGGDAATEAILSSHRDIRSVIMVDWDKDGRYDAYLSDLSHWVSDVTVDRALKGSAPEEVLLIEGSAAAEISITIGGEDRNPGTAVWLPMTGIFSKYQRFSPFYGKNLVGAELTWTIQVNTEFGTVEYPQFVGQVRTIEPDRASNTVTITALDRSELLRRPVRLCPWAIADEHIHTGKTGSQLAHSHWIIDTCLRQCGVSSTPKRPVFREEQVGLGLYDGLMWYLTGNGSYLPTIGYMDNPHAMSFPADSTPMYASTAEKHPVAGTDDARPLALYPLNLPVRQVRDQHQHRGVLRYWVQNQDELNPVGTHYLGFTLNANGPNASLFQTIAPFCVMEVTIGRARLLEVWISAGKVYTRIMDHSSGQTFGNGTVHTSPQINIPTGQPHVDIHVQWDTTSQSGVRCQVKAGSNDSGWVSVGAAPATSGSNILIDQVKGRVTVSHALSFSDMFYAVRYYQNAGTNGTHEAWREAAYGAVLDRGLNRFSYTPSKAEEAWKFITDVAAAEYGSVFWDEDGIFRFWNYDTMRAKQSTSVRTFSLDDFTGLKMSDTIDSVRNIYNVQTTRRRGVWAGGVYKSSDVGEFYTPGQSTRRFKLFRADIQSPLTFFMNKYSSDPGAYAWPKWDDDVAHGYCIQYYTSVGWAEMNERAGVNVSVYFSSDGFLTVRVTNGWSEPIRFAKGLNENSSAAFHIQGTKILEDDPISVQYHNPSSVLEFGPQILDLDGDWHQEQFGANLLIPKMGQRTLKPIPATDAITVPGDPRIQLGDMVTLTDAQGLGARMYVQILGIRREWSRDSGLTDTYSVEVVAQPGSIVVPDEPPPDPEPPVDPEWEADVYVATTGSDSNNGLTPETPKLTLAGGLSAAGPGDTIKVFDGTYTANFATSKAGTSGNPITFRAANKYGAILSGNGSTARQSTVEINHSYINFRDFTITGANGSGVRHGIVLDESVTDVEITGNKFHNIVQFQTAGTGWQGGAGIDFWGPSYSNILIEGNIFYNIGVIESGEELTHGIYCGVHGTNFRIQNNLFYDIAGYGIHPYPDASSSGIEMYNNTITGNLHGIRTVNNCIVRNNLCFENARSNFNLQGTGSTIQNNLVGGAGGGSGTGITTITNPLFVNWAMDGSGDFRLQAGSPALDAGTSTGAPTRDLLGVPRPQGGGIDCGAYERPLVVEDPGPDPVDENTPTGLTATPNNGTRQITLNWNLVPNAESYNIYSWYYRNGTLVVGESLVGTVITNSSVRGPLETDATYYYQVSSVVNDAESQRTPIAWAVLGTDSTGPPTSGGGGNTGSTPAQILNIGSIDGQNRFKLGYGLSNGGAYREVSHSGVTAGEVVPGIFEPNSDNSAVFFRVPVTAGTTGGSEYPRTELREMQLNGTSLAEWNGGSGTHYMNYRFRVPSALPATNPWTCIGQIHGASGDIFRVQIEGGNLRVRYTNPAGGSEVSQTIQAYSIGTWIDARIEVVNGNGRFLINNVEVYTFNCNTTGCYFKVGNYLQTNASIEADDTAIAVVELASYPVVWHTGYPDPALPGGGDPGEEDPPPGPGGGGSGVPVGPTVDFIGDYNTGNFGQYSNIQCKVRNGSASGYDQSFYGAKILDGGGGHSTAFRCEIRDGDVPDFGGGERCEVRAPSSADVSEGDERWYEFSMKLDSASALPSSGAGWFIVMQWHAGSGSPPCCIELKNDGNLYVRNNALNWQNLLGSLSDRQWHDFVLHVKFSNNASTGFIEGWRDGVKTLNLTSRRTMSSSSCYYKQGIYRDAGESNTVILWHDGLRVTQP